VLRQELEKPSEGFFNSVKESIDFDILHAKNSVEKGRIFLEWVLTKLFDVTQDQLVGQVLDKANDMGIDFYNIIELEGDGKSKGIVQLFQVKYGKSYDVDKEIANFESEINDFLKTKTELIPRDDIKALHHRIEKENLLPELYFITNQNTDYEKKGKVQVYGMGRIVKTLWDEFIALPKGTKELLKLENHFEFNKNSLIGVLAISELVKFVNKTKSYIFESNIRKYLRRTKVNTYLIETLKERTEDVFYFNNGVTIVVTDYNVKNGTVELIEPQIVNGAQTSTIISETLNYREDIPGFIQLTIIKDSNKTTREDITRFRNSQNAVKGKDLISLKHFHTKIRLQLHQFGFHYETQAGTWINMPKEQKLRFKGNEIFNQYLPEKHLHLIPAKDAIQAMVAGIFQNPTKPYSSIASFMPGTLQYDKIFDDKLEDDYRLLLYPYLVKCYSEVLGYGDVESDPEFKRYARLLFVAAYFRILYKKILNVDENDIKKDRLILDKYFHNPVANKELMNFVNVCLVDHYFPTAQGYMIENGIPSPHNFFSRYAWDKKLLQAIDLYVSNKKTVLKEIVRKFK